MSIATGYAKYTAQWYGLPALFHPITIQSHKVISAGNPIELELSNKYVIKGVKSEKVINSIVSIHVNSEGKIEKVEDKWNGKLPEGVISEVRAESFYRCCLVVAELTAWAQTFRKINAATAPKIVTVPKTEEEDIEMQKKRQETS